MLHPHLHHRALAAALALLLALTALVSRRPTLAHAQVSAGTGFASAVPCLGGAPTFATTSMANTITGSGYGIVAAAGDPALLQVTATSHSQLAPIGSMVNPGFNAPIYNGLGAVYGLAYDDGSVSGIRRIFAAAYLKRSVSLGPAGLGGIYEYRFADGTWRAAITVPDVGSVPRQATDVSDAAVAGLIGRVGLGDLEMTPDGRTLYAMNLHARRIERYDLTSGTPVRQSPLAIPLSILSASASAQADMQPFALGFWPAYNATWANQPTLVVGVVDTATRSPGGSQPWIFPRAYVMYADYRGTGSWGVLVNQDLHTQSLQYREIGSTFLLDPPPPGYEQVSTWNPWQNDRYAPPHDLSGFVRYPQPLLTDISFSHDGMTMYVGLRDRSGDMYFSKQPPAMEQTVMSQGDVLVYHASGASWVLQGDQYGDVLDDNSHIDGYGNPINVHIENLQGAVGVALDGAGPHFNDLLMTTSLLGAMASGTRTYKNTDRSILQQQTIAPSNVPAGGKATALGDVEPLCTYALAGGRVWQDNNYNGIQDAGEPGVPNVQLEVFQGTSASDPALAGLTTDSQGAYLFAVPPNTPVNIRIAAGSRASMAAQLWEFTRPNQTGNEALDSDVSQVYGYIELANPTYSGLMRGGVTGIAMPMLPNRADDRHYDIGLTRVQDYGTIGDRVWDDMNHNGVQDSGEPGHAGYPVTLSPDPNGMAILPGSYPVQTTTDSSGIYRFRNLPAGRYRVQFAAPAAPYQATLRDAGGNDAYDSDVDVSTGYTTPIVTLDSVAPGNSDTSRDFGLFGGTPDVWVYKSGPPEALVGTTFRYTLAYGNAGSQVADGVTLIDTLPAGLSYVAASPAPSSVSGQTLTWSLGTLPAGFGVVMQLTVRAPASLGAAVSQPITNRASISTTTVGDPPGNNSSSTSGALVRPEVSLIKTAPASVLVGDPFSYTLAYANTGSIAAASVTIADTLPAGLTLTGFSQNPGLACSYAAASRRVQCSFPSLAAGASGSVVFTAVADTSAAPNVANTATISTATSGDDPSDNTSTATTAVQFPNPGVGVSITPAPFPVGERGSITATYQNSGTGLARGTSLTLAIPPGVTLGSLPGGCSASGATIACALGDLAAGATGSRVIPVSLPADFPQDQLAVAAAIATATPERPADLGDNTAAATVSVVRPNVFVTAAGPSSIVGQGSAFWYTVDYGNQYRANPSLTRDAENVELTATLPADVTFVQADVPPTSVSGQTLIWSLGTLAANVSGQIHIVVQTDVPAGATLRFTTDIRTSTPGDDPSDNHAVVDTTVVQPPDQVGQSASDLKLAIHSEFDPNSQDSNPTNGVYISDGAAIAWPAGEVLDFTPRLDGLTFPDEPLPFPYEYRARVIGWSVAGFTVNGATRDPQAADSRGVAGCRARAQPSIRPQRLDGCAYAYLGGQNRSAIASPAAPTELALATQAHAYWTYPPPPMMRSDVYLYTLDPLESVQITIQVEVEVWIVNAYPGAINGMPLPEILVVPLPDPARQRIDQAFTVHLLVPRSVIGPSS